MAEHFSNYQKGQEMTFEVCHEDDRGEIVDVSIYCSNYCAATDPDYAGWSGGHEVESCTRCAHCGDPLQGFDCQWCREGTCTVTCALAFVESRLGPSGHRAVRSGHAYGDAFLSDYWEIDNLGSDLVAGLAVALYYGDTPHDWATAICSALDYVLTAHGSSILDSARVAERATYDTDLLALCAA